MKWNSIDGRKMINLDSVDGYVFVPAKDYLEQYPDGDDSGDFKINGDRIELIISGTPYIFRGAEALEIYSMLRENNTKQLLEG